jgi:hypothetical protein
VVLAHLRQVQSVAQNTLVVVVALKLHLAQSLRLRAEVVALADRVAQETTA